MLRALCLAGLLLAASAHALTIPLPTKPGPPTLVGALHELMAFAQRDAPPAVVPHDASLTDAVARAYAALGFAPPPAESTRAMRAQEAALDGELASGATRLLDALLAQGTPLARALTAAQTADALAEALRAALPELRGGILFSDPFNLVLIGGSGPDTYTGNSAPAGLVHPSANLLTIDLGGDDTYVNNAGGAGDEATCPGLHCGNGLPSAAAIDLSGNDTYAWVEDPVTRAVLPVQGAAIYGGVALLLDLAGNDHYRVRTLGPIEVESPAQLAQGAGVTGGVGLLVDEAGDDTYEASMTAASAPAGRPIQWVQGGGDSDGDGALVDGGGNDAYSATQFGTSSRLLIQLAQGAGANQGVGLLLELDGHDHYYAEQSTGTGELRAIRDLHVQGVGEYEGAGTLLDMAGDDDYLVVQPDRVEGDLHIAQGEGFSGFGLLVDGGGRDSYSEVPGGEGMSWVRGTAGLGVDSALPLP